MKSEFSHGVDWGALLRSLRKEPLWRPGDEPRTIPFCAEAWLNSVHFTELSAETQFNYYRRMAPIVAWSKQLGDPDVTELTEYDVANFLSAWDDRPFEKVQVRSQFKRIMEVPVSLGWRYDNPVLKVHVTAPESRVLLWREADVQLYAETADRIGLGAVSGIIQLNWQIGSRLRDVCKFTKSVNLDPSGQLRFFCHKTGEYVSVPVSGQMSKRLLAAAGDILFPNPKTGEPYSSSALTQAFSRVRSHVAGWQDRPLTLRTLRHSYCVEGFIHGSDAYEIASVTGHKFATVHELMGVYAPADSRFAHRAQERRGFTHRTSSQALPDQTLQDRRRQVDQTQLRRVASPRKRKSNNFRG